MVHCFICICYVTSLIAPLMANCDIENLWPVPPNFFSIRVAHCNEVLFKHPIYIEETFDTNFCHKDRKTGLHSSAIFHSNFKVCQLILTWIHFLPIFYMGDDVSSAHSYLFLLFLVVLVAQFFHKVGFTVTYLDERVLWNIILWYCEHFRISSEAFGYLLSS